MRDKVNHADDRKLRQFSFLWVLFSIVLTIRFSWPLPPNIPAALATGLAVLLGVTGWIKPRVIRPFYVSWMVAVYPISWFVSRMVLAVLFYVLFTPLGLLLRILGRNALALKFQPELGSYWVPKDIPNDSRRYFEQY